MNPTAPLLIDLAQLALELAGIIDPIGVSVVSSRAVSLARGSFSDAGISAASVVPSVGNAAGYGKIGRYLEGLRRACRLGLKDLQFGRILRKDLPKLQGMLRHLTAFPLPTTVRVRLFEMDTEISRFLEEYPRAVLKIVDIPHFRPVGLIAGRKLRDVTQSSLRNALAQSGIREAHNSHFLMRLIDRGPTRGIRNLGDFARELNAGIRQLGKEPGTVEVLLPSSGAKVVANLRGELLTFEIGDFHTFVRQSGLW